MKSATPANVRSRRERDLEPETAISQGQSMLKSIGLTPRLILVDSLDGDVSTSFSVTRCELVADDRVVARGSGKGYGQQAFASALYEAIENFFMIRTHRFEPEEYRLLPIDEIASDKRLARDKLFQLMRDWSPGCEVACTSYSGSDESNLWLPICVGDVSYYLHPINGDIFDYRPFLKYMSTNGIASGIRESDAVLHGLLELVERDALSRLLMSVANLGPRIAEPIDRDRLPVDLEELCDRIAFDSGVKPQFFDVQSFGGVATCVALCYRGAKDFAFRGSGSSLWWDYALERSTSELWQDIQMIAEYELVDESVRFQQRLAMYPALLRTMSPNPADFCVGGPTSKPAGGAPISGERDGTAAILGTLGSNLRADGFTHYSRTLVSTGPAVVHVYVPGFERFVLVTRGNPMIPTATR